MKICFIPDWLEESLRADGQSRDILVTDFDAAIVSKLDVINYHKAQFEFFKLLTRGQYCEDDMYSMYQNVFVHELPDMPEVEVYVRQSASEAIIWDEMAAGSGLKDRFCCRTEVSACGTVIYIIGEPVSKAQPGKTIAAEPQAIICDILKKMNGSLRIHNGFVDKSSVFRESPLLTQLYVNESFC